MLNNYGLTCSSAETQRNSLMNFFFFCEKRDRGVWSDIWCSWDVSTAPFRKTLYFCREGKRNVFFDSVPCLVLSHFLSQLVRFVLVRAQHSPQFQHTVLAKNTSTPMAQHPLPSVGQRKERGRETKRRWGWVRDKKRGSSELQLFLFNSCCDSSTPRYDGECGAIFDGRFVIMRNLNTTNTWCGR